MVDLMGHIDETMHLQHQTASQQIDGTKPAYIGYIQDYNVDTGLCTVIDPLNCSPGPDGGQPIPIVSGPIPLCTSFAGLANGQNPVNDQIRYYGVQVCPFGGASIVDPTGGEQVLVANVRASIGYQLTAFLLFNAVALPPGALPIPVSQANLDNGEWLGVHPSGTVIHMTNDGNLNVYTQGPDPDQGQNINAQAYGGIGLTTAHNGDPAPPDPLQGDIDLTAVQDINMAVLRDIIMEAQRDILEIAHRDHTTQADRDILEEAIHDIEMTAGNDLTAVATTGTANLQGHLAVNVFSDTVVTVTAPQVLIGAAGEVLLRLLTEAFLATFDAHTHDGVQPGAGISGAPTIPVIPGYPITTIALQGG